MAKSKQKAGKLAKRRNKLNKRLRRDFEEMLELSVSTGTITRESLDPLLKGIGDALIQTEKEHGQSQHLREAGRFLEHLHSVHHKIIEERQFEKEKHDLQTLIRVRKMDKKGKKPEDIAKILSKEGEHVTPEAIQRILESEEID